MLQSPICELLEIRYPVLQGGMAWIADGKLAAAVSEGGGLGIISAMNANASWLREQIREAKSRTSKPFGVNIMLMSPFADDVAQVVVEEQVPVVTTGAGNPSKYMSMWKSAGIRVIPVVASVALARMMEKHGAVAVIAEGGESGGHIGEAATIPLVAKECGVHPVYKEKVLKAKDIDTIVTGRRLGHACRGLKNAFSREYAKKEWLPETSMEELEAFGVGSLRKAAVEGNEKEGSFLCGQIAGLVTREQPAAEILQQVCEEAEALLKGASQWVNG